MKVLLSLLILSLGLSMTGFVSPPLISALPLTHDLVTLTEIRLVLNLKQRRVYVYQGNRSIISYPVAIGRKNWETPTGQFTVIQMVRDPYWEHPLTGQIVPRGAIILWGRAGLVSGRMARTISVFMAQPTNI